MLGRLTMLVLLAATAAGGTAASSDAAARPGVRPVQELARLLTPHTAHQAPRRASPRLEVVAPLRPITGEQTALPVVGHSIDTAGRRWVQVRLPGRPNSHTGWIEQAGTIGATTSWRIVVELSHRSVTVYQYGRAIRIFSAVVGRTETPTPRGAFFVEEVIALPSGESGAPFALALSARSNVFQQFAGGPGQIALHGLAHVGGVPGTAASHGCVRLGAAAMTWLVTRIAPGDSVTIRD